MIKIVANLAAAILLLAAFPLHARNTISNIMQATVPFEFLAGDKVLPAGNYTVEVNAERGMIVLRPEGQQPLVLLTNAVETLLPKKQSQLVFHRYGTAFVLLEVWRSDESAGRALRTSDLEKELGRKRTLDEKIVVVAQQR